MEIVREQNHTFKDNYDYSFIEGNKILKFHFAGNLDLYMLIHDKESNNIKKGDAVEFYITKENYAVYSLFEKLHEKITTGKVFSEDSSILRITENFNQERNIRYAIEKGLINYDDEIEWYCDNYPKGEGDSLKIIKEEDQYRLIFKRHSDKSYNNLSIRVCNSGSRYLPFNCCFMDLYHNLQHIDPDNYQIHIEEYLYKEKVKK